MAGEGTQAEPRSYVDDVPPTTPFDVVYEDGVLRLRRYRACGPERFPPVLLVYSLIKRPYILDLLPGRSVVASLQRQGFPVYLTDWSPPRHEDASRGLEDYDAALDAAIAAVRRLEHVERVALIGFCLGGFLAVVYAALHPAHVERLAVVALPFEWQPPLAPAPTAAYLAHVYGNIPSWWIRAGLNARVADRRQLPSFVAAELDEAQLAQPDAQPEANAVVRALGAWFDSDVPFAGRLFAEVMDDAYGRARLATSRLMVGDRRVELSRIRCPVLNVCAERDRIARPEQSLSFIRRVGSADARNLVFATGHLGLMVGRAAHESLWPHVGHWLANTSDSSADALAEGAIDALGATGTG